GEGGRLLLALTRALGGLLRGAGARAALSGRVLVDVLVEDVAPHLPVRDLLTLRSHHHGLSGDDLAEALTRNASRVTAGLGAAAGALASAELAAPPALLAAPVQLAAETLAVVVVELKLVAELHVVYGRAPRGTRAQVAAAYLSSWAGRRGLEPGSGAPSVSAVLSSAAKQQLRQRIARRMGRNATAFAPFLAGAVAGAELNRRETRGLAQALMRDLKPRR
ncbi:MAG: hypothetical protein ACXVGH_08840, partial [Mycobacteriales bacterium]